MNFRKNVGIGYGPFWRGVIFDREYKMLDDLVNKSKRWFYRFGDGAKFLEAKSDFKWVWPTGEELLFRSFENADDYWNYHGQEFPWIGWNELTKYPTGDCFDVMMSCNRSSFTEKDWPIDHTGEPIPLPEIPLRVFATTNPFGSGHNWVKRRFITVAPYGEIVRKKYKIFNPRTQADDEIEKTQVAIFGSWRENIYLSPEYIATLSEEKNPNRRKAWEAGSWDIAAGGAIDDLWNPSVHVKPRFAIPSEVYIDRAIDWGSSTPFWVGWFAEADGEDFIMEDGSTFNPPPGSLILFHEWYGSEEIGTNVGLKLSAKAVAEGINEIERNLYRLGWIGDMPYPGPADNQINNVNERGSDTIKKKMEDAGVYWETSDKSRGSRIVGLQLFRDRLEAANKGEGPAIYIMEHCRAAIDILPTLPRDPDNLDDIDTNSEDHPWDGLRFRLLKGNDRAVRSIRVRIPH